MSKDFATHIPLTFPDHRLATRFTPAAGQDFSTSSTRLVELSDAGFSTAFAGTAEIVGFRNMRDELQWARGILSDPGVAAVAASGMSSDRLERIRQAFGG